MCFLVPIADVLSRAKCGCDFWCRMRVCWWGVTPAQHRAAEVAAVSAALGRRAAGLAEREEAVAAEARHLSERSAALDEHARQARAAALAPLLLGDPNLLE